MLLLTRNYKKQGTEGMPGRKYIDPKDQNLPKNIIAIEGYDWQSALHQIERAMRVAPVNYGNFMDLALTPSINVSPSFAPQGELGRLITNLMNGNHLHYSPHGCMRDRDVDIYLTRAFHNAASSAKLDDSERYLLQAVFNYVGTVIKPLLNTWPGRTAISLEIRDNDFTLNTPNPMFVQGVNNEKLIWRKLPFFGSSFQVRMSFNTLAQAIYDDNTVVKEKSHEWLPGGLNWYGDVKLKYDKQEDVWHPRPWSISVLSPNIWTHRPVVQSSPRPMGFYNGQQRRLTVQAVVQRL